MKRFLLISLSVIMSVFCLCGNTFTFAATDDIQQGVNYENGGDEEDASTESEYVVTTEYPDEPGRQPDVAAESVIVMDAQTGSILFEKNAYDKVYPASTTKIMTCYLALQNTEPTETLTMSYDAVWGIDRTSNHIALTEGESITMEEGIYAMMLESANEVSWAIGEHISDGDINKFAELMTSTAKDLGCKNTQFKNANGLPDEGHFTTAYDMALITKAALTLDDFRTVTSTLESSVAETNLCDTVRPLNHHCKMIKPYSMYYYEFCEGGKTGYTEQAYNTLVTWAKKDDMELICVIMNCMGSWNTYTDSKALYEYCFNNFKKVSGEKYVKLDSADTESVINNLNSKFGTDFSGEINLSLDKNFTLSKKTDWDDSDISCELNFDESNIEKIDEKTFVAGKAIISYAGNEIATADIYADGFTLVKKPELTSEDKEALSYKVEHTNTEEKDKKLSFKTIIIIVITSIILLAVLILLWMRRVKKLRVRKVNDRKNLYEERLEKLLEEIENED